MRSLRYVILRLWVTWSRRFRGSRSHHLQCQAFSLVLLDTETEEVRIKTEEIEMHALRSVETSETTYPTTLRKTSQKTGILGSTGVKTLTSRKDVTYNESIRK
jgi:hypothetical protein